MIFLRIYNINSISLYFVWLDLGNYIQTSIESITHVVLGIVTEK